MIDTQVLEQEKNAVYRKIQLSEALERLMVNPDFVVVFKMYYFKNYVLDMVNQLSGVVNTPDSQILHQRLVMVSQLQAELDNLLTQGAMAKEQLQELNAIPLDEYTT
ncbi:hypothetical protein ACFBZI_09410 [Moraxella sp. ZJ142]|uniref:hypothetical protein n=1 Tax=Moraxella marmotae TaxID=3344520 RepID=UPI0035D51838